jgi:DNA-binding MarR family transcriptional regulator
MSASTNIATGLSKIGMLLRASEWARADTSGLTPTQSQILVHLVSRGPARVTDVAEEIAVTQPTASDSVSALVRKGMIRKRSDPADARAVLLHPTPAGRRVAQGATVWPDALLAAIDVLEPDEQAAFLKGLTKMIRTMQVRGAIPIQRLCVSCRHFQPNKHKGTDQPHHCAFVDAAFGDADLRLDCGDHEPAEDTDASALWAAFASAAPAE